MTKIITISLTFLMCFTGFAQSERADYEINIKISPDDYEYIKAKIKEDVINWCYQRDDKLDILSMKLMLVRDTVVPITIKTDTGDYEIDIISEFQRRAIGGFAGSYPFVQSWKFDISEEKLIEIIKEIKTENPSLQVRGDTTLTPGRYSYWYFIDFFDKGNNEVISTWTRKSTNSTSTLALVGYFLHTNNPYEFGIEMKLINRDFWKIENDNRITRFETIIVNKIKEKIK
ncbi:MAG: hypothetical protein KDD99_16495 [Bacteroidetes bacterium]|nr:hypothetical protein [Bacteroidota bacterium]